MSKTIGPEGSSFDRQLSSEPRTNDTTEKPLRQEGKKSPQVLRFLPKAVKEAIEYPIYAAREVIYHPKQVIKHLVNHAPEMVGAATIAAAFAAIKAPIEAKADTQQSALPSGYTLLHGEATRASLFNKSNILILDWNNPPFQEILDVTEDLFTPDIPPLNEFSDITNVIFAHPTENLECTQNAECKWSAVNKETDKLVNLGVPVQANLVVIKSNDPNSGAGGTRYPLVRPGFPLDNHHSSSAVRPATLPPGPGIRLDFAGTVAHEVYGHQRGNFDHEGGDLMESKTTGFNENHQSILRKLAKLWPFNIEMARLKAANRISLQSDIKLLPTLDVPVQAEVPAGTVWVKLQQTQEEGPEVTLEIGDGQTIDDIRQGKYTIPAPKIGVGSYITRQLQRIRQRMWFSNKKDGQPAWDASDWTSYEAQPGLFLPSAFTDRTFQTPDLNPNNIKPVFPAPGSFIKPDSIAIQWSDNDPAYYFRIQVSPDKTFNQDPQTATASVWDNRIHGGQTTPLNSWKTPPLTPGTYYWRTSVAAMAGQSEKWGETWQFTVQ